MNLRHFSGQCVVITGAAGGLGQALVRVFLQAGANVVALDRDARVHELAAGPPQGELAPVGGSNPRSGGASGATNNGGLRRHHPGFVRVSHGTSHSRFGGIDVLVNNAGIAHRSAFADTQVDVLRRVMEVNFFGAVHCTHAAIASLRQRQGMVIAISSVAGFSPLIGRTGYAASKHALHGFFDSLRTEVQDDGVDVLIVCPSFIDTGIDRAALGADGQPAAHARKTAGATTQPQEVAAAILKAAQQRKTLLLFSLTAKAAWWLSRLWPARYAAIMKRRLQAEIFPVARP
jgi:NAD(P)-dependent dehydrogenase (short-subunit alcohol dehydrogenase family)